MIVMHIFTKCVEERDMHIIREYVRSNATKWIIRASIAHATLNP
jgi:hypothetical protein